MRVNWSRGRLQVKRRTDVVGVFPDDAALLRLTACALIEAHDEWAAGDRRYLSEASMAALNGTDVAFLSVSASAVTTGGTSIDTGVAMTA